MAYRFRTTKQRSLLMKKIRSNKTKPEIALQKSLRKSGIKFKINYQVILGKPDVAIVKNKIAVFVDGEFWHGYRWREKKNKLKANRAYWIPKIERTIARDRRNNRDLKNSGWQVIRFWQHEVFEDLPKCIQKIKIITKKSLK